MPVFSIERNDSVHRTSDRSGTADDSAGARADNEVKPKTEIEFSLTISP